MMHQMFAWICWDLQRTAIAKLVIRSKSLSHFGPKAFNEQVGPINKLGFIRVALSHKTCRHNDRVGYAVPIS